MTRPLGDPRLLGLWQKGHSPVLPSAPAPQGSRVNQEKYKLPHLHLPHTTHRPAPAWRSCPGQQRAGQQVRVGRSLGQKAPSQETTSRSSGSTKVGNRRFRLALEVVLEMALRGPD